MLLILSLSFRSGVLLALRRFHRAAPRLTPGLVNRHHKVLMILRPVVRIAGQADGLSRSSAARATDEPAVGGGAGDEVGDGSPNVPWSLAKRTPREVGDYRGPGRDFSVAAVLTGVPTAPPLCVPVRNAILPQ